VLKLKELGVFVLPCVQTQTKMIEMIAETGQRKLAAEVLLKMERGTEVAYSLLAPSS
jgi:hypothetical protein